MDSKATTPDASEKRHVEAKPNRLWSVYDAQRLEKLIETERHLACLIAAAMPGDDVFDEVCRAYESLVPGAVCTIMELSGESLNILASPSVPETMRHNLNGVRVGQGSCGSAIREGGPVFVADVYDDERCRDLLRIFDLFQLRTCWSIPFRDEQSRMVGTFAINLQKPTEPSEVDRRILETAGYVVSLAYIRQQAERRAHARELNFQNLSEALVEGLLMADRDGSIRHINRRFIEMTGYDEADFAGHLPRDILIPDDERQRLADVLEKRAEGIDQNYEAEILRKDGSTFWAEVRGTSHYDSNGNRRGALATIFDISERKQVENMLKLTQFAVDSAAEAMFTTGEDGLIRTVNQTACDRLGYRPDELRGMHLTDLVPDFDRSEWPDHWKQLKELGQMVVESRHQARDGRIIPVEVSVAYFEKDGEAFRCSFARDISDRKQAERRIRESQQHVQAIAEHIPGIAYIFERTGNGSRKLLFIGPGLDALIGPKSARRIMADFDCFAELIHPDDRDICMQAGTQAVDQGQAVPSNFRFRTDSGRYKWVNITAQPIRLENDRIRWHVVALDVDRQVRAEQMLISLAGKTSGVIGEDFFASLAKQLAQILELRHVLVCEQLHGPDRLRTLAFWRGDHFSEPMEFPIDGTLLSSVAAGRNITLPANALEQCPDDQFLRTLKADGFCGIPLLDPHGSVIGQMILVHDQSIDENLVQIPALQVSAIRASAELQRHRTEAELHRSETNLRMMFEQMPAVVWTTDTQLEYQTIAGTGLQALDLDPAMVIGTRVGEVTASEGGSASTTVREVHQAALNGKPGSATLDFRNRALQIYVEPLHDRDGQLIGTIGLALDITELKQTNRQLELLMRELDHRVRNNLASLISIARQTADSTDSVPRFLESLTGRITSMAVAYDVISSSRSRDEWWRSMLQRLLVPFVDLNSDRIDLIGAEFTMLPSLAFPLSMVIYELATNAAKHGALRDAGGRIEVSWSVQHDKRLSIGWREYFESPAAPHETTGFGLSVIEGLIEYQLHGTIDFQFEADGMRATISVPIPQEVIEQEHVKH